MQFSVVAAVLLLAIACVSGQNQPSLATLQQNDIHVLQYALILENLEYYFYSKYQAQFTPQDFINAGFTQEDYSYFSLIQSHELAHVQLLNSTVPAPTSSCTYNFPVTDVHSYIAVAKLLENTGVSAYDGAINNFYDPELVEIAATIATIEGRHASFLNNLNGVSPFPAAFDTALNSTTIADMIFGGSNPIAACTFANGFALPQLYIVYPIQNASDPSQPTSQQLAANDITVLQYALFLEHLEAAFYSYVLNTFNASQLGGNTSYNYITMIGEHEKIHVSTLTSAISGYATPIGDCTYSFASVIGNNATLALTVAAALEATGVGAYDGAANAINSPAYKQVAATIVTVEARHASYINYIVKNAQGPIAGAAGAFDLALTFNATVGIVLNTNLINNCPAYPSPYSILVVKPYTNATTPTSTPTAAPTTAGPTVAPTTAGPTVAPTVTPATSATATPTSAPTSAASTTGSATTGTVGPTSTPTPTATGATTRGSSTTARTSGASIASASVVVALLVAFVAL